METRLLEQTGHRPWPLPAGPWVLFQSWRRQLFAHWRVPAARLRPLVPAPLVLEEHDGSAWLGLTPFEVHGMRPRLLPALPFASRFGEVNLRTYVRFGGRPGVFLFSLDAGSRIAAASARTLYRLPYHSARVTIDVTEEGIRYRCERDDGAAAFVATYQPSGPSYHAEPGSLDHFLAERYALYTVLRDGTVLRGQIHHAPWPLQPAEVRVERETVTVAAGLPVEGAPELLHYSERQDTLIWPPERLPADTD